MLISYGFSGREAMTTYHRCNHCKCFYDPNPRVKNQHYCGSKTCQRYRKTLWQRVKMATDPDYQANQRDCQKAWRKNNPDYWCKYRLSHPEYVNSNRMLQRSRNTKRRYLKVIVKMDTLNEFSDVKAGIYYIVDANKKIANMDAFAQKVFIIPERYVNTA